MLVNGGSGEGRGWRGDVEVTEPTISELRSKPWGDAMRFIWWNCARVNGIGD